MSKHGGAVVKHGRQVAVGDDVRQQHAEQTRCERTTDEAVPGFAVAEHAVSVRHHASTVDRPRSVPCFGQPFAPHHGKRIGQKTRKVKPQCQQTKREEIHDSTNVRLVPRKVSL